MNEVTGRSPILRGGPLEFFNEHTNRLLRQYLPKRTDISHYTQAALNRIGAAIERTATQNVGLAYARRYTSWLVAMTG
jgi:hypothetical protein